LRKEKIEAKIETEEKEGKKGHLGQPWNEKKKRVKEYEQEEGAEARHTQGEEETAKKGLPTMKRV